MFKNTRDLFRKFYNLRNDFMVAENKTMKLSTEIDMLKKEISLLNSYRIIDNYNKNEAIKNKGGLELIREEIKKEVMETPTYGYTTTVIVYHIYLGEKLIDENINLEDTEKHCKQILEILSEE